MKITDLKCAMLGSSPVVRIVTDAGIDGFAQAESWKPFLKPLVLQLRDKIVGLDPTDVEQVMLHIRHLGGFKPWGAAVSVVEIALWDIAGKAAGLPVYKLLGGKQRDRVRVYNGGKREPLTGFSPEDYARNTAAMLMQEEGFTIVKQPIGFHGRMEAGVANFFYGDRMFCGQHGTHERGVLSEYGLAHMADCVQAMKEVTGDRAGLALDCGPGWTVGDATRFAIGVEKHSLLWLEDLLSGDYVPYVDADLYAGLTRATTTPIHTGEQIYLRQNFRPLIETKAVNVIGPDPCDVGGLAELKWIAEYADLHGIQIAPHGIANGLLGLAALVQVCATLPRNFIAFEYPVGEPDWWYDIVDGFPEPIVRDGHVAVPDTPGLGITINPAKAGKYLSPEDGAFFD
ncbi:mandelate racemase/muconate lactonizing enzyme family protein [Labrenzia sp. OB1]|uniref:mandelate racemase/muconate lactonizing enzyme family protein n=1 Tax=Labrenzia sp. OB1 TaxID=1561204 RepID=UPI0007B20C19|nr:mandelate racemase/muconate lactonizing enzyme family protein [Labrenzia sp. OB1]KZM49114.1 mandelate racemase [Labrenzia sp. OB1]